MCGPLGLVVPLALSLLVILAIPAERRIFEAFMGKPAGAGSWRDVVAVIVFALWLTVTNVVLMDWWPPRTLARFVLGLVLVAVGMAAFAFLRRTARKVEPMPGLTSPQRKQVREATRRGNRLEDPALAETATQVARGASAWRAIVLASAFAVFGVLLVVATASGLRRHGWLWLVLIVGLLLVATPSAIQLRKALRAWRLNKR